MAEPHPPSCGDAIRVLALRGPLTDIELGEALDLAEDSPELDELIDDLEEDHERVVTLADDRLADAIALVAGRTLTHRLTAEEVAGGWIVLDEDLAHLGELAGDNLPLADGGRLELAAVTEPLGWLVTRMFGPSGWLDGVKPGALLGVRIDDGLVHVTLDVTPDAPEGAAAALSACVSRRLAVQVEWEEHPRVELSAALWEALADEPDALGSVLPPLTELADAAALNRRAGLVADSDYEWPGTSEDDQGITLASVLYGLEPDRAKTLQALRRACVEADAGTLSAGHVEAAASGFADAEVTEILVRERRPDTAGSDTLAAVEVVARAVADAHNGSARAGALAVLAHVTERAGDPLAAEKLLTDALDADPDHWFALEHAASYAEDRGDARRALALLGRAGWETREVTELRDRLLAPRGGERVGRNDPCPCGSGRKFKRCCDDRDGGPIEGRADWVASKLTGFIARMGVPLPLRPVLRARFPEGGAERSVFDPLVADLATFDLGLLDEFLRCRGPLLPADEAALVASWRDTRRSAYRLDQQNGDRLRLTDLRSGAQVTAFAPGAPLLDAGTVLLGRLVPSGGPDPVVFWAPTTLGNVILSEAWLTAVCDGDDVVAVAAALPRGMPVLRTTEGEPLLMCEARYRLDGPADRAVAALADLDELDIDEAEPEVLRELVEVGGMPRVRGTIIVMAGEVRINTNASARADRLRALVERALGDTVTLLVERRTPMWQAMDDERLLGIPAERHEPTGEEQALIDAFLREREEAWIDEPLPALGGLTPRQAVEDPERRHDLEDLLEERVGLFDHDRLRMLLGLG